MSGRGNTKAAQAQPLVMARYDLQNSIGACGFSMPINIDLNVQHVLFS